MQQGCFFNSITKMKCSSSICISMATVPFNKTYKKNMMSDKTPMINFCCCTSKLCNNKTNLKSRFDHNNHLSYRNISTTTTEQVILPITQNSNLTEIFLPSGLTIFFMIYSIMMTFILASYIYCRKKKLEKVDFNLLPVKSDRLFSKKRNDENTIEEVNSQMLSSCESDKTSRLTVSENTSTSLDLYMDWDQPEQTGAFGKVFQAIDRNTSTRYCIKVPLDHGFEVFHNEIRIFNVVTFAEDRNIVRYYGIHQIDKKTGIILEHCSLGSLRKFLRENEISEISTGLKMMKDLASAIAFLHSSDKADTCKQAIAHRDITSANLLLRSNYCLVVADFGTAAILDEADGNNCTCSKRIYAEGTFHYQAPEVLNLSIDLTNICSSLKQADIYSMSLVMWEIATRCKTFYKKEGPIDNIPPHSIPYQKEVKSKRELIDYVVLQGNRPSLEFISKQEIGSNYQNLKINMITSTLVKTLKECWDKDEDARLAASCVCRRLTSLLCHDPIAP